MLRYLFPAMLALLAACSQTPSPVTDAGDDIAIRDRDWKLLRLFNAKSETVRPPESAIYTLRLDADGHVSGQARCNRYTGSYTFQDGAIAFSPLALTRRACPPPGIDQRYFQALQSATRALVSGGRLVVHAAGGDTLEYLPAAGADSGAARPEAEGLLLPEGHSSVWRCEGDSPAVRVLVRQAPQAMALWLPDEDAAARPWRLSAERAASGARYTGDGTEFWSKGDEAMLTLGERHWKHCVLQPRRAPWAEAKRRGVAVRASGNEPGWILEITPGRQMRLNYDYGQETMATPVPEPRVTEAGVLYRADTEAHSLRVTLRDEPCTDDMAGDLFGLTVEVRVDGRVFQGCGERL